VDAVGIGLLVAPADQPPAAACPRRDGSPQCGRGRDVPAWPLLPPAPARRRQSSDGAPQCGACHPSMWVQSRVTSGSWDSRVQHACQHGAASTLGGCSARLKKGHRRGRSDNRMGGRGTCAPAVSDVPRSPHMSDGRPTWGYRGDRPPLAPTRGIRDRRRGHGGCSSQGGRP
jgi:hypothetical protein